MNAVPTDRTLLSRTSLIVAASLLVATVVLVEIVPSLPRAAPHVPRFADAAILCGTHHCLVDRARVRQLLDHPNRLGSTLRIVPRVGDGRMYGFRLFAIRPGSLPARLLLRNGDEIRAMNRVALDSPDAMIRAYRLLRDARTVSLDIVRNGQPLTLTYAIR